jgi:hypothetical protein
MHKISFRCFPVLRTTFLLCFLQFSLRTFAQGPMTITATVQQNASCFGFSNGIATVTVTGGVAPYTYSWEPFLAIYTQTASNLAAGSYYVIVMDTGRVHIDTAYVTITEPSQLMLSATHTNVTCTGLANGTATAFISGGTPPYRYVWGSNPVQTTATATGLPPGVYSLSVADTNACSHDTAVQVVQPGGFLTASAAGCKIKITATDSLGVGPYSWYWSTNNLQSNNQSILVDSSGTYSVVVMDTSYCFHTDTITVHVPVPPPVPVITLDGGYLVCNASPPLQWYLQGVPISGIGDSLFHPSVDGVYTVRSGPLPCTSTSAPFTLTSAGILSYDSGLSDFSLYPNPGTGLVQIGFPSGGKPLFLQVNDLCGRELLQIRLENETGGKYTANLEGLRDGIYLLSVSDESGIMIGQKKYVVLR